ncbi:MAG TPA: LemA family protein, partial [Armatimonadota bacterium]|nr:LemA family protein [Armatimonadota bacterium]
EREELAQRQAQKRATTRTAAWITAAVLAFCLLFSVISYNGLNSHRLAAAEARANLQSTLQRRSELIPRLRGWALEGTARGGQLPEQLARAQQDLASTDVNAQLRANEELNALLPRVSGTQAGSQLYSDLMAEDAGSANRINVARQRYNRAVTQYNQSAQSFPNNLVRPFFGLPGELPPLEGASGG